MSPKSFLLALSSITMIVGGGEVEGSYLPSSKTQYINLRNEDWNDNSSFLNPIAAIAILLSFIFVLVILVVCVICCQSNQQEEPSNRSVHRTNMRLDPVTLASLPTFKFNQRDGNGNEENFTECAVCLLVFERGDDVRLLPNCNHIFHVDCIDPWFDGHSTCPCCRAQITPRRLVPLPPEPPSGAQPMV